MPEGGLPKREIDPVAAARGQQDAAPQRWALWRLDDNGNRFLMETFDSRERAEAAARDYTARGHKQTYWVERG